LATQALIIFVIRTRRIPFFRSTPSVPLVFSTLGAIGVGIALTLSPLASHLGFTPLPWPFFAMLALLTMGYLVLVEFTKKVFYADPMHLAGPPVRTRGLPHRIERRVARFAH